MKKLLLTSALVAFGAPAFAGGLDRSGQSVLAAFDDPDTASLSFGIVTPSVTGSDIAGGGSYDVGESYTQMGASYTNALSDTLSYTLIYDQPFGADVNYAANPLTTGLGGTSASIGSDALTFVLRNKINDRMSVFGGLRLQAARGEVALNGQAYAGAIAVTGVARAAGVDANALGRALGAAAAGATPATADVVAVGGPAALGALGSQVTSTSSAFMATNGYNVDIQNSLGVGYTLGVAYEIPEIALRFVATYNSKIEHKGDTVETLLGGTTTSETTFETPQSVNLEFQTGIAEGTLLTAGVRWAEWGSFDVIPQRLGSDLANIDDSYRWTVGIGRQITDELAASASISYEAEGDTDLVSPLAPNNGQVGLTLGMRYAMDNGGVISGGINYTQLGDARAEVGGQPVASFTDNHAIGFGFKVNFEF